MYTRTRPNPFTASRALLLVGLFVGLIDVLLVMADWSVIATVRAEDMMYRCDDGSFTNRAEAACAPYSSPGSVTVAPDGQPPPSIRDRVRSDPPTITAVLPPPAGKISKNGQTLCGLYDEWHVLRHATNGGTVFHRGRDVARWQALSRLFQYIDAPQCDVASTVRSAQASR
jgi:hypothetical protein